SSTSGDIGLFLASPPINWAYLDLGNIGSGVRVAIANLDGDEDGDVIAIGEPNDRLVWFENNAPFGFEPLQVIDEDPDGGGPMTAAVVNPISFEAIDFDFDDDIDILVAGLDGDFVLFRNDGPGFGLPPTFTPVTLASSLTGIPTELAVADIDDDGDSDVFYANATGRWRWIRNDAGMFTAFDLPVAATVFFSLNIGVADIDVDGDLDVYGTGFGGASEELFRWWDNNGANPPSFTERLVPMPLLRMFAAAAGDFDDDGWIDLAAAGLNDDTVSWWRNDTFSSSIGWSVMNGDFQNLGSWDILAIPRSGDVANISVDGAVVSFLADAATSHVSVVNADVTLDLAGSCWDVARRSDSTFTFSAGAGNMPTLNIDGGELIARNFDVDPMNTSASAIVTNAATLRLAPRGLVRIAPNLPTSGATLTIEDSSNLIDSGDGAIHIFPDSLLSIETNAGVEVREVIGEGSIHITGGGSLFFPDRFYPVTFEGDILLSGPGSSMFASSDLAVTTIFQVETENFAQALFVDADIAVASVFSSRISGIGVLNIDDFTGFSLGELDGGTLNVLNLDVDTCTVDFNTGTISGGIASDSNLDFANDLLIDGSFALPGSNLTVGDVLTVTSTVTLSGGDGSAFVDCAELDINSLGGVNVVSGNLVARREINVGLASLTAPSIELTAAPLSSMAAVAAPRLNLSAGAALLPANSLSINTEAILSIEATQAFKSPPIFLNIKTPSTVNLGGTLEVTRAPDFNPAIGERIDLIVANSISGN
ncbi:MAG: FG-GAP-like repeat-containing protein, partial [Planctomycetota bacterium]|nr:FG-GAP-like repeat-containing protein [Planctomycetota bacterium]